jgi:hypothetical protein
VLKKVQSIKAAYEAEDIDLRLRSRCSKLKNNKRKICVSDFELKKRTNKPKTSEVGKREVVHSNQKATKRYHPEPSFITGLSDGQ